MYKRNIYMRVRVEHFMNDGNGDEEKISMGLGSDELESTIDISELEKEINDSGILTVPEMMLDLDQARFEAKRHVEGLIRQEETSLVKFQRRIGEKLKKYGEYAGFALGGAGTYVVSGDVVSALVGAFASSIVIGRTFPKFSDWLIKSFAEERIAVSEEDRQEYWQSRLEQKADVYGKTLKRGEIVLAFPLMTVRGEYVDLDDSYTESFWLGQVGPRNPKVFSLAIKWDENGQRVENKEESESDRVAEIKNNCERIFNYGAIVSVLERIGEPLTAKDIDSLPYGSGIVCFDKKKVTGCGFLGEIGWDEFVLYSSRRDENTFEFESCRKKFKKLNDGVIAFPYGVVLSDYGDNSR